jgi:hypothetical protein
MADGICNSSSTASSEYLSAVDFAHYAHDTLRSFFCKSTLPI